MLEVLRNLAWGEPGEPLEVGSLTLSSRVGRNHEVEDFISRQHERNELSNDR